MKWMTGTLSRPYLLLGVGALLVGGIVVAQNMPKGVLPFAQSQPIQLRPVAITTPANMDSVRQIESAMTALAESASQAVVHITTNLNRLNDDETQQRPDQAEMMRGGGEGSGFLVRSDGWIVTNEHVVAGREEVAVILADGRALRGKVVPADDPQLDLAVVKIDARDLPTLELADSNQVRPGQFAIAIGAPFGIEDTVTIGHVSGVGRTGMIPDVRAGVPRSYSGLIQTDASINPGNSGGPLINSDGKVIGVNSSIVSSTGSSAGIGFAIPANFVRVVTTELIEKGKFDRGAMGVLPRDLKPYEKKRLNLGAGALVGRQLDQDTPAYKAGIRPGDVIVRIGNQVVSNEVDLRTAMYAQAPGDRVDVTYVRDGREARVNVALIAPSQLPGQQQQQEAQPRSRDFFREWDGPQAPDREPTPPLTGGRPRLGVQIQNLDPNVRRQFSLPNELEGVAVMSVMEGSLAAQYKLEPGDVIRKIGGRDIRSVQDVSEAMGSARPGEPLTVEYTRVKDGATAQYSVTIPIR